MALISGPRRSAGKEGGEGAAAVALFELGRPKRKRERGEEKVGERADGESWASRPK